MRISGLEFRRVLFRSVDILVNNAGTQFVSPIEDFPPEKWDLILALNLTSSFHTIRHVVPGMRKTGWGRIIATASAHSLVASPFKSAYVARSEEHTSELQSLMRHSYSVFSLTKKKKL